MQPHRGAATYPSCSSHLQITNRSPAMNRLTPFLLSIAMLLPATAWSEAAAPRAQTVTANTDLAGAWKAKVQFKSGMLADWKNLQFMYAFNQGGTMTESSNYDGSPPGPPAYGVWRKTGVRQFEARYEVWLTKSEKPLEEIAKGGGWLPDGHGILSEKITLSADGKSFKSVIRWDSFDQAGKAVESAIEGIGEGRRMGF